MNLYIADLHFGHRGIIRFDHRPFMDVADMDKCLIKLWNSRVSSNDDVYVLGDFAYKNRKPEEWYLRQLRGTKHLIIGNHDQPLLNNNKAMSYFETVDQRLLVSDKDEHVCLCHYPMASWQGLSKGYWHIYGHIHMGKWEESIPQSEKALNASACINGYTPSSLQELIRNNARWKDGFSRMFISDRKM
ncbi:hypothetical protein IMSAGC007_03931 [Lachnospiraceae bacterium]|nr:hypothetical protein IMSAGC007_03931 [Lachnospiraceae bacterium]